MDIKPFNGKKMMNKHLASFISIYAVIFALVGVPVAYSQSNNQVIKATHDPFYKISYDGVFTIHSKIRAQNNSLNSIYDVVFRVLKFDGATVEKNILYLGSIKPGETVVSESFVISFDYSVQEPPQIFWQVEYVDIEGNYNTENKIIK